MTQRIVEEVTIATSATTSNWINTDFRFDESSERLLFGALTSGDSIQVEIAASTNGSPSRTRVVRTYTSVGFDDVLYGPVPRVRFVKTGANGPAWVVLVK